MGNSNSSNDGPPIQSSLLASRTTQGAAGKHAAYPSKEVPDPSYPYKNPTPVNSDNSTTLLRHDKGAAAKTPPTTNPNTSLTHRGLAPPLVPPSPFVGSPLLPSDYISYSAQSGHHSQKESKSSTPSQRQNSRHAPSEGSFSSAEEDKMSVNTAKGDEGLDGVLEAAMEGMELTVSVPASSLESGRTVVVQPPPTTMEVDQLQGTAAQPVYTQPPNERSYKNSAKIVHASGISGLAPLAPLSRIGDGAEKKRVIPIIVTWNGGGKTVYVTGTFNNWKQKVRLSKSTTDFTTVVDMPPGTHRFKFIVDDEWKCSEELPVASDPDGNLVNYLEVQDENGDHQGDGLDGLSTLGDIPPSSPGPDSPTDSYSNEIPPYLLYPPPPRSSNPSSASPGSQHKNQTAGGAQSYVLPAEPPPQLPAHLEKVLLNANPVATEDASVLPVPIHVSLNHLYACSIRDGVMALATTTRYKKKYVTTVLYKPVFS